MGKVRWERGQWVGEGRMRSEEGDPFNLFAACPCLHTTPCHPACTCLYRSSSKGCRRCCSYGSKVMQHRKAVALARVIDHAFPEPDPRLKNWKAYRPESKLMSNGKPLCWDVAGRSAEEAAEIAVGTSSWDCDGRECHVVVIAEDGTETKHTVHR